MKLTKQRLKEMIREVYILSYARTTIGAFQGALIDVSATELGAIVIKGKNGTTRIAEDTWRTAGTSQKVASGFGDDLKNCIKGKVAADRDGV